MAGRTMIRSPMGCSGSIPNCATAICIAATSPVSASNGIGPSSSPTGYKDMRDPFFPRRGVLAASIAGAAVLSLPAALRGFAAAVSAPTPAQTEGPFYPLNYPSDSDNDLVHVTGHAEPAPRTVTRVPGHLLHRPEKP